jgi:hypothetical protein
MKSLLKIINHKAKKKTRNMRFEIKQKKLNYKKKRKPKKYKKMKHKMTQLISL